MDDCFTIHQYKPDKPKNNDTSTLFIYFVWKRYAFHRSKIAAFQTYNKKYGIKNIVIWIWDT